MFNLFSSPQKSINRLMLSMVTLILSIIIIGCSDNRTEVLVLIDNPTTSELTIAIDGKEHSIKPRESYEIKIPYGMHAVEFIDGPFHSSINHQKINAYFTPNTGKGTLTLNPTNSTYIYTQEYYYENEKDAPTFKDKEFIVNGLLYNDQDAILQNGFLLDNHGGLNVNESFPDEVYVTKNQKYGVKTKLFRYEDYDNYYRNDWSGVPAFIDQVDTKPVNGNVFITFNKSFEGFDLSPFEGREELIALLKKYESNYRNLINDTTSSKHFYEMSKQLSSDLKAIESHPQFNLKKDSKYLYELIDLESDRGKSDVNFLTSKVIFFKQ